MVHASFDFLSQCIFSWNWDPWNQFYYTLFISPWQFFYDPLLVSVLAKPTPSVCCSGFEIMFPDDNHVSQLFLNLFILWFFSTWDSDEVADKMSKQWPCPHGIIALIQNLQPSLASLAPQYLLYCFALQQVAWLLITILPPNSILLYGGTSTSNNARHCRKSYSDSW